MQYSGKEHTFYSGQLLDESNSHDFVPYTTEDSVKDTIIRLGAQYFDKDVRILLLLVICLCLQRVQQQKTTFYHFLSFSPKFTCTQFL